MKVTPLNATIALGRKLEELKNNGIVEMSPLVISSDTDLNVLLPFALMIANKVQSIGFEPLSGEMITPEFVSQLENTMAKYLP